jgi:hypothetical protein
MELYGWDIVYGASVDIINQQMAQQMASLITSINYSRNDTTDGFKIDLDGHFGNWFISDGQDSLIEVTMPIQQGTMTISGDDTVVNTFLKGKGYKAGVPFDISNVAIKVTMPLSFHISASGPDQQALTFDFVAKGDGDISASDIVINGLNDPQNKILGSTLEGPFKQAFREVLTSNRSKISYEFATVMTQGAANNWASPKYAAFYYSKPENSSTHYFHILAMVNHDNANGISPKLDPVLFNNSSNRYLAFSRDIFLHNMIQPGLPWAIDMAIYPDIYEHNKHLVRGQSDPMVPANPTPDSKFEYDFNAHTSIGKDISLDPYVDPNVNVETVVDSESSMDLNMQVQDNAILTNMDSLGINYDDEGNEQSKVLVNATYRSVVSYDLSNKQFVALPDPNPVIKKTVNVNPGSILSGLFSGVGDTILAVVIIPVLSARFLEGISGAIQVGSLSNLPISWTGLDKDFQISSAGLSGNIYLVGRS